jgi:hypothetical protein
MFLEKVTASKEDDVSSKIGLHNNITLCKLRKSPILFYGNIMPTESRAGEDQGTVFVLPQSNLWIKSKGVENKKKSYSQ